MRRRSRRPQRPRPLQPNVMPRPHRDSHAATSAGKVPSTCPRTTSTTPNISLASPSTVTAPSRWCRVATSAALVSASRTKASLTSSNPAWSELRMPATVASRPARCSSTIAIRRSIVPSECRVRTALTDVLIEIGALPSADRVLCRRQISRPRASQAATRTRSLGRPKRR